MIGEILPIIETVPEILSIDADARYAIKRTLSLFSTDGRPFEVRSLTLRNVEGEGSFEKLRSDRWRLSLQLDADSLQSGAIVLIETDNPLEPHVDIPIVMHE